MALYSLGIGGSELLGVRLTRHYLDSGMKVVCCVTRRGSGPLIKTLEGWGVPVKLLNLEEQNRFARMISKRTLRGWFRQHRVDCIHAQHFCVLADVYRAARNAGVKSLIVTEHTAEPLNNDPSYARITARLSRKASHVVAINEVIASSITALVGSFLPTLSIITNGIDTTKFSMQLEDRSDRVNVIWLGRLHPDKDIITALRAFATAVTTCTKDLYLRVVGDGEERGIAEEYVRTNGLSARVAFDGEVLEPVHAIHASDIFFMSSVTEGTPLAMLEAMSCGLPVVATKVGGIPEVVSENVGLLFQKCDFLGLARGLVTLAESKERRKTMGLQARSLVSSRFSEVRMAEEYIKLIRHSNSIDN